MGHCVGGYGAAVKAGTTKIFSLRNANNLPHATIEVTSDEPTVIASVDDKQRDMFGDDRKLPPLKIVQIKGRSNKPPVAKYVPYVKEFMEWGNFDVRGGGGLDDIRNMGLYYKQGKYYNRDEVSKVIKKYKDGTKWIKIDDDVEFDYGGAPYYLLDKEGNEIITANTHNIEDTNGSITGISEPYGKKVDADELRPKIVDLLNKSNNIGDTNDLRNKWGIYHSGDKHGGLKEVGAVMYNLPNGYKAVSASDNNYVVNKKHEVIFEYEIDISDGLEILKQKFNPSKLDMNFGELANALSEVSGFPLTKGYSSVSPPVDNDNNTLEPRGDEVYEGDGISWYTGVVPSVLNKNSDPDSIFIGYDRYKNARYYITTSPNESEGGMFKDSHSELKVEGVGDILNSNINSNFYGDAIDYTQGEQILRIIIDQEWDTSDESFRESMYDDYSWIMDKYDIWYRAENTAPAEYKQMEYDENDEENEYVNENSTINEYWTNTGIPDSGMGSEYMIDEYGEFFNGKTISWDETEVPRDVEDPETGEYTTEYYSIYNYATFTGNADDYKHPLS